MTGIKKMKNRNVLLIVVSMVLTIAACNSKKKIEIKENHEGQVQKEGTGMIYVDNISCNSVMQGSDSAGSNSAFQCFRVGFIDSLVVAKAADKKSLEAGKYYQYDVQNDWTILVNGDSVKPVFYQPRQRVENHRYEGILVFEITGSEKNDTLIYNDSFGTWGTQQIIINSNKK